MIAHPEMLEDVSIADFDSADRVLIWAFRTVASGRGSPRAAMHALRYRWRTPDLSSTMREKKRR